MKSIRQITCVGDCGIDTYQSRAGAGSFRLGGCTLNVAMNMRHVSPRGIDGFDGFDIRVVSAVGNDVAGDQIIAQLEQQDMGGFVQQLSGCTPEQRLAVDQNGERHFITYEAGVLGTYQLTATQTERLAHSDCIVTVAFDQIAALFKEVVTAAQPCRQRGGLLAIDFMTLADFGGGANGSVQVVREYLNQFDIGFFGLSRQQNVLIDDLRHLAFTSGKLFVVTLGAAGALAFINGQEIRQAAFPVEEVVDTTGAGDSFAAAFLSEYLLQAHSSALDTVSAALAAAARHAAMIVGKAGGY